MDFSKKPNVKIKDPILPKQIKFAFIGDSGVGKSSLVNYSIEDERIPKVVPTDFVDIVFKTIKIRDNAVVNFGMWDFSGKSESLRIRTELYPELYSVAYCFDLSNASSFNNLEAWLKEVKKFNGERMFPVCLGLKSDLNKVIDMNAIQAFIQKNKMNYFEISIKDARSVNKFFRDFGSVLYDYFQKKK